MEGDFSSTTQRSSGATEGVPLSSPKFPDISFVPEVADRRNIGSSAREKCAIAGAVVGGIAVISWFVIVVGTLASIFGIALSLVGRNSSRAKYARIGLILSAAGGGLALIYMLAIYMGFINYNYFTNELWGIPAGGIQTLE